MDLLGDLYTILFENWTPSEERFLFLVFILVLIPVAREIRDRLQG